MGRIRKVVRYFKPFTHIEVDKLVSKLVEAVRAKCLATISRVDASLEVDANIRLLLVLLGGPCGEMALKHLALPRTPTPNERDANDLTRR